MDRDSFIYDLIIDPDSGKELIYDEKTKTLGDEESSNRYDLMDSVPRIIAKQKKKVADSDLHKMHNSEFDYIGHYQIDSELFDYSEKNEPASTRHEIMRLHQSIIKEIKNDHKLILDIGCGNGWAAGMLIPKGKRIISLDVSSVNAINAYKNTPHSDHAALIADVYNIPLRKQSIDCIIASEIMEHLSDPGDFISGLSTLLKPGGKLIITTPYNEKIESCLCIHCNKSTPKHGHLHSFNKINILKYLPDTGFRYTISTFSNKYLMRLRMHVILKHFHYVFWKAADNLFRIISCHPTRMKLVIVKE